MSAKEINIEKIVDEILNIMESFNYNPTDKEIKKLLGYNSKNKKEIKVYKKQIRKIKR